MEKQLLFDTHLHVDRDQSPEKYTEIAKDSGVGYFLAAGGNYEESLLAADFADKIDSAWFAAGVHPHEAAQSTDEAAKFATFLEAAKFAAVGEIGLDYFYENSERVEQRRVFETFLSLATEWKKPVIVHCRDKDGREDAYNDIFHPLKNFVSTGGHFVLHCYTGTVSWAEKFLELGGYLGVTGIVTFPKADNVREVLEIIPDERLLLETDAPYLAPAPFRGKKNHSVYLPEVAKRVAIEKNISLSDISTLTTKNAFTFFNLLK